MFREIWNNHKFEFQIMGIGIAISLILGLAASGNIQEALAHCRGR